MREFYHEFCKHQNGGKINRDLFTRSFEKPLWMFIVNTCKNLEVLPPIKFDGYELITNQVKIKTYINKALSRDKNIRNNASLERLIPLRESVCDMLVLHFTITLQGISKHVTRKMLVFKQLKNGMYIIRGKRVVPLIQVVDNSTYVKGESVKFKTGLVPIDISTTIGKIEFTDGESRKVPIFKLDLFTKIANPLLYFLAKHDVRDIIEFFKLDGVMGITSRQINPVGYKYVKLTSDIFIEVNKQALEAHPFVIQFVATLYDAMKGDKTITHKSLYDTNYWLRRLAEIFGRKTEAKGKKVLISFDKILDPNTKAGLLLKRHHVRNTFTLIRWMMTNYPELLKKDNHDLGNKRIRSNECIAYYFDTYVTQNMNSLLNSDNAPMSRYEQLLNSISEFTLFKAIGGRNPYNLFQYECYNDYHAINLLRYTFKGPTGLNGGKHKTSVKYCDIYTSHLGRFDLNVCSSGNIGLAGQLTINCKIDESGHFSTDLTEPDFYDKEIVKTLEGIATKEYRISRERSAEDDRLRNEEGFIELEPRVTPQEMNRMMNENPKKYGLFKTRQGLVLFMNTDPVDNKGFISLTHKDEILDPTDKMNRDKNGFIILEEPKPLKKWDKTGAKVDYPADEMSKRLIPEDD